MIRCIVCDEEQAALLAAAADMAHAALAARQVRVDPEGVISKSLEMSRVKTKGLLDQLEGPALTGWQELTASQRSQAIAIMRVMASEASEYDKVALWPKLQAFVLLRGASIPVTYSERARKDGSLSGYPVATVEGISPKDQATLRKMRGQSGD